MPKLLLPLLLLLTLRLSALEIVCPDSSSRIEYALGRLRSAAASVGAESASVRIVLKRDTALGNTEAYRISRTDSEFSLVGGGDSGLMYAALDLARRVRELRAFPATLELAETPTLKLRGPCIGMQKTTILPGHKVYEYPYTSELFPFFYDKAFWADYLDFLAENRMNTLYLWNGHPFASLVRLPDYPYALEVSEEQFARNVEMFRYLATEAERRGIWVVQMFYSIILSKPFAEHHGISTQLADPLPVANDYMRKSIAEFVRQYPSVGLMVCLGEALTGVDDQRFWLNEVVLPGVKDGMQQAGLTTEPPVVIRTHATDLRQIMPSALKLYSNLYTEAKYNGESLTTSEPRGVWQQIHLDMSRLGSTHLANVHILANLEPFRYGAQDFIRKCMLAARDRLGAGGLHLYPLAYWAWPEAPDATEKPLSQLERDWIWFEAWARYAWNPDVDPAADREYWLNRLTERYGTREAAQGILDAYNASGECAPRLLRRFGITEGNRQTLSLGMTLDQLVTPAKYRPYEELWKSQAPEGERLQEFADKEWHHIAHGGETPANVVADVTQYSAAAVAAIEAAAPRVTRNREEFERLRNDILCIEALSLNYAAKARAAMRVLRFGYSGDMADMDEAVEHLTESLNQFRRLEQLTRTTYRFANTMQTNYRRIPVPGVIDGQPANYHWTQLLPIYEKELVDFRAHVAELRKHGGKLPGNKIAQPLKAVDFKLLTPGAETFGVNTGSKVFADKEWEIQAVASEIAGLRGIRVPYDLAAAKPFFVEIETAEPVEVLLGYVQSKDPQWLQTPMLETDALAGDFFVAEPLLQDALSADKLPKVHIHVHRQPAGRSRIEVRGSGAYVVLGVVKPGSMAGHAAARSSAPQEQASSAVNSPRATKAATARKGASHEQRYRISACDWMMLKRQKLGALALAHELGADGLELDMGSLGKRPTFQNALADPAVREQFIAKSRELGVEFSSLAMSGFYAQSLAGRDNYQQIIQDCLDTMAQLKVKVAFLPLGVQGDLVKYPQLRQVLVERLRTIGKMAEQAGVVIGIETALDAAGEVKLLEDVGSPGIRISLNFANALEAGRDLVKEIKILGSQRIIQIHCTDKDGFLLRDNPRLDMKAVKAALDELGWSGWLIVERSRDAKDPRNVRHNFGANIEYLKSVFQ